MRISKVIKQIFCNHSKKHWIRNVYGDEINMLSTYKSTCRSIWKCENCGKIIKGGYLKIDKKDKRVCS